MPVINKPSYVPYKWYYTCNIFFSPDASVGKVLIENDPDPLMNPLKLVNLKELIQDKSLNYDGLPGNPSTGNYWYTYVSERPTDIDFPINTAPVLRAFAFPNDSNIDESSLLLYIWDPNNHIWVNADISWSGEALMSVSTTNQFQNYKFISVSTTSAFSQYFAIRVIPNN